MKTKTFILFFLIALFAFSPEVIASNRTSHNFHYKIAKKKTSTSKKSKLNKKNSTVKTPQAKKTKRIIFPFA
jgi:LAS superfamily LD-carboxypeptidase LdcB